jgi:hypothetical protein
MLESDVTKAVWAFLKAEGWDILSLHYPGAGGGLYFHPNGRVTKGARGAMVVDIVARKTGYLLLVESKVRFDHHDVGKLVKLTTNSGYRQSLLAVYGTVEESPPTFLRGLALGQVNLNRLHLPGDFLVFCHSQPVEVWGTYTVEVGRALFYSYRLLSPTHL